MSDLDLRALDYLLRPDIAVLEADAEWIVSLEVASNLLCEIALEHHLAKKLTDARRSIDEFATKLSLRAIGGVS